MTTDTASTSNHQESFRKMGEALAPRRGTKRAWDQLDKPSKALAIGEKDMAGPNSYGDGKTLYINGKTFNKR